ncbi:MAG: hypothetical protein JSW12_01940 [Deltaproteobacteria bacterium]|nr:MAG: hypothetical protein JSW12_01940 [Deltaproteobacteria bacterium]
MTTRNLKLEKKNNHTYNSWSYVIFPRLLIGVIILICAEVFSGASLQVGLWHPWTWLVTYWLYFAHFFFFTTLAIRTGKTSLGALYLWGVLFGLYESWITKVIWYGYSGDGIFAMGNIGPYGYSEISMVFMFHPIMSFILPLAVSCVIYPQLRRWFPDLAWFTRRSKGAFAFQVYLVFTFATIIGMNSGGPFNLALNLVVIFVFIRVLTWLALSGDSSSYNSSIVVFGNRGFLGLCIYLVLLYGVSYVYLRPKGLPSVPVQLLTFVFYAFIIAGLWLHRSRQPQLNIAMEVEKRELRSVKILLILALGLGFFFSFFFKTPELFLLIMVTFLIWTPMGFVLTAVAFLKGVLEHISGNRHSDY